MKHKEIMLAWANVAMKFAYLEWGVQKLLADLIDNCNGYGVGMLACDDYSFAKKIDKLKELAEYRLYRDKELTSLIIRLCDKINNIRAKRNLFVHGNWKMNNKLIKDEKLFLESGNYRRYKKNGIVQWGIDIVEWPIVDFHKLSKQIDEILMQIEDFQRNHFEKLYQVINHKIQEKIEDIECNDEFGRLFSQRTYNLFEYERIIQKRKRDNFKKVRG